MILEYSEKGIVFFPDPYLVGTPADYGLKYEEVWFAAEDGVQLHGWWGPKPGAPVLEIALFGPSLGSALAVDLAVRVPCRSLIIESAFTNSSDMARLLAPFLFDWRPRIPYDNIRKIHQATVPVLIIHGREDEI